MTCEACKSNCQRVGKHRNGLARFRCPICKKTYTEAHERTLGTLYTSQERANLALQLLLEGNSIRSTERITQLDRNTIMRILLLAGDRCQKLMYEKMRGLRLNYLQCVGLSAKRNSVAFALAIRRTLEISGYSLRWTNKQS